MPYKSLYTFDKKSGRNSVGATSMQMEFLRTGTKSRDKTIKKYRPEIKTFFDSQTARIVDRFNKYYSIKSNKEMMTDQELDVVLEYILPLSQEDVTLRNATKPMHTSAIQKAVIDVNEITGSSVGYTLGNTQIATSILRLSNKITGINKVTQRMLKDILTEAVANGTNIYDIARQIQEVGSAEWYAGRSFAIARTETRMAYDLGGGIAYNELGAETFSVIGCIGTLAGANDFGYPATYGDFKETIGSCGVTDMPMNIWDGVSGLHHCNHLGVMVADKIP